MNFKDITKNKVFFIAEIGKNFIDCNEEKSVNEYLKKAKKLVLEAKKAGANAVKFQTHNYEDEQLPIKLISPHFKGMDRYNWVKKNTLSTPIETFWKPLKKFCDKNKIIFISTPMSRGAAKILNKLNVPFWKVGSGDLLDFVMLDFIASTKKPVILSTGMSNLNEIEKSINFLKKRNIEIIILHCVSKYPCPKEELNLSTINLLKDKFELTVGFSDHSLELDSVIIAVSLGAKIIEKHFTLDRNLWGSDHKVSLLPEEFSKMVNKVRDFEKNKKIYNYFEEKDIKEYLGINDKILYREENEFRKIFRKCIVASKNLNKNHIIKKSDIYAMRPKLYCKGLSSEKYENILGKKINKSLNKYEAITKEVLV